MDRKRIYIISMHVSADVLAIYTRPAWSHCVMLTAEDTNLFELK